jgi:very-short-patch-repair endonuclease
LWKHLRSRRLAGFKFRRQEAIEPYVVDFVCLETKLVVEADGGQHAERTEQDSARTEYLESLGYKVVRFWNHEILGNTDGVLERIHILLVNTPHPGPLPEGEGEQRNRTTGFPLPPGDDCMDAGGRATPGAVAEVRVRGYSISDVKL